MAEDTSRGAHPTIRVYVQGGRDGVLLTDAEANEIRLGLALGIRGPVLIKWCGQLLADRDERRARECALAPPWPGPLSGPRVAGVAAGAGREFRTDK
jgi:hypothetical protein